jgi:hypothetical protein
MKDDTVYLRHIEDCIRRIEDNVAGGKTRFLESHTLQDAVLRNLQTLSESTQRLSDKLKSAHPDVLSGIVSLHFVMCLFMITWALTLRESGRSRSETCPG